MIEFRPTLSLDYAVAIQAREAQDEQAFEEFLAIYERRRKERLLDPNLKLPLEVEYALTRMMVNDLQDFLSQLPGYPYNMLQG